MNKTLKELRLDDNRLDDKGAQAKICKVLIHRNETLIIVRFEGNDIRDQSVDIIIDMIAMNQSLTHV